MTPEGRVKKQVNAILDQYQPYLYKLMVVPGGYGETTLDYICCFRGLFFSIETKRPGKEPTNRQQQIRAMMERAGGKVFKINGERDLAEFKLWMEKVSCLPNQHPPLDQPPTQFSSAPHIKL